MDKRKDLSASYALSVVYSVTRSEAEEFGGGRG